MKALVFGITLAVSFGVLTSFTACKSNHNQQASTSTPTAKVDTVIIKGMQFHPAELHVNPGDTIVWINKGIVAHDVTEDSGAWSSGVGNINTNQSWKRVAGDQGFSYHCSIHPTMKAKVVIK